MSYTPAELLQMAADERKRSVGFDTINSTLLTERTKALDYIKGDMKADVPSLPNRSSAVSTDIADAIETWLSDMVEILAGGEDVVTFQPNGPNDEEQARQETDYVNHVFFAENGGFMVLYTMLKDAGQVKTGVVTWWEEDVPQPEPEQYTGQTAAQVGMVMLGDQAQYIVQNVQPSEQQGPEPLFDFEVIPKPRKRVRVAAVNPQDFTIAGDTVKLSDATYCAMKLRPRAQDLIADGVDQDIVDRLPPYSSAQDMEALARDTAGEHLNGSPNGGIGPLRTVEIVHHYLRVVDDDGSVKIWRIRSGSDDAVLIDCEEVDSINFAAITPYPVTHRFYGESIADKGMELQKIRTSLMRSALDSAYFALNQRVEVAEDQASENTIPDLLRNEPGMPVRSKNGQALRPLQAGSLGFDPFSALEYFATVFEQRTGVVRNAQGLNPDTLHDTATGAQQLMGAAQKRTRLMARIFAETGIKDLYLGLHAMLRRIGGMTDTMRLRGQWVNIDPTQWGERTDMVCEVGVGSSGKAQDLAAMGAVIQHQAQAVQAQGGLNGPLVNAGNLYASAIRFTQKAGLKDPEAFWNNPATFQPQPPQPDPKLIAAQQDNQVDQARLQIDQQKNQADAQAEAARLNLEARKIALEQAKIQLEAQERAHKQQLERDKLSIDARHMADKLASENALRLLDINAKYKTSIDVAQVRSAAEQFRASADVAMQAQDHAHDRMMLAADHMHDHALAAQEHAQGLEATEHGAALGSLGQPDDDSNNQGDDA